MADGQIYYKRIGYVAIEDADGNMRSYGGNDGLDFRFRGEKVGDMYAAFEVGLLGLAAETINDLTVWNPAAAIAASRKIAVYAGYENGGIESPLFEGIIVEAIPTNPPEMWLNFKCIRFGDKDSQVDNPEMINGIKILELFRRIGDGLGIKTRWNVTSIPYDKVVDFDYSGSKNQICAKFASSFGVMVYEENGILYATELRPWMQEPDGAAEEVNQSTGMLALGNITLAGATIKTRLNDRSSLMSWIHLTSKIIPRADGMYIVIRKRHSGQLRGQDWTTELETIRYGAKV